MYATIRIGDLTLTFAETRCSEGDERHTITALDSWEAANAMLVTAGTPKEKISKTVVVNSETEALEVLADFLRPEEPIGPFKRLFPHFMP